MGWLCTDCREIHEGKRCPKKVKQYKSEEDKRFMSSARWQKKRLEVLDRDCGCVRCRVNEGKIVTTNLEVHHIIGRKKIWKDRKYELLLDNNNLITLCRDCHQEVEKINQLDFEINREMIEKYCL